MNSILRLSIHPAALGALVLGLLAFSQTQAAPTFEIAGKLSSTSDPLPGVAIGSDGSLSVFGATRAGGVGKGSIFKARFSTNSNPAAFNPVSSVLNFSGANGQTPLSGLTLHTDGNLYGSMSGTSGWGKIYRVTQTGTLAQLVTFTGTAGSNAGSQPTGTLVSATNSELYGITTKGGDRDLGTIYKLTASGTHSVLKSFQSGEGRYPLFPPIQAQDGDLYGTTSQGGSGPGMIYKISTSGSNFKVLYHFGLEPGYEPNSGLFQGKDGLLYGTCYNPSTEEGQVYRISTSGSMGTPLYQYGTNLDFILAGVVQGPDGNFYGTSTKGGEAGYGVVYQITASGALNVLHHFRGNDTLANSDGANPKTPLSLASDGNIYGVTNSTLFRIRFGPRPLDAGANSLTYRGASLWARLNPNGENTTVQFQYALNDPFLTPANTKTVTATPKASGSVPRMVDASINRLQPTSTYYYRMMAVNRSGTQFGVTKSFRTKAFGESDQAIDIDATSATLQSWINPNGNHPKAYFQYDTDPSFQSAKMLVTSTSAVGTGYNDHLFQRKLTNLTPRTTYYYRIHTLEQTGTVTGTTTGVAHSFSTKFHGTFNGLVVNDASTGICSGYLSVQLNPSETMTGVLMHGGVRYALKGHFLPTSSTSPVTTFHQTIPRNNQPPLIVRLTTDPATNQITGTITDGKNLSQVSAGNLSLAVSGTLAGYYTVELLPHPSKTGTADPRGVGYLGLTVTKQGSVRASGKLCDGSPVVTSGLVVSGSILPLYQSLYGSSASKYRGSLYGSVAFLREDSYSQSKSLTAASYFCTGILNWYKAENPAHSIYPRGFETSIELIGGPYRLVGSGTNALSLSSHIRPAEITFDGDHLSFSLPLELYPNNTIKVPKFFSNKSLALSFDPVSGKIRGSYRDFTGEVSYLYGIALQGGRASGFFHNSFENGGFLIELLDHFPEYDW